ncbi:cleavage polyadenylation factor subunit FIP1 [Spizellomyces punctatus DAOM BR117]|uniref:Pre-mRNA polyadenylation factor Fip1 domain-containing protein n=1 Tax=Spizellomyces punctatus (strain DAOM BR117) TaxID=645134 RepID=A0A0L0H8P0_SPIPD|nr:cleavage polyadenylation factor subunit FIP1 [Spizellomyces punctatus DAOM BR117]KNC97038.1 hypothetical protein SPPG_07436 [Spizellomyces punctatus DAOM BR117]|eukprot:XP_016605078.1 hypothetical protein SPPG_07436 [Spizellomyces punctatus DAOM BR117]
MDELDEFLFGESATADVQKQPQQSLVEPVSEEEDDVPYEPPEDDEVYDIGANSSAETRVRNVGEEDEYEDDDSDDDIEIVLDTAAPSSSTPASTVPAPPAQVNQVNGTTVEKPSPITRSAVRVVGLPIPRQDGTVAPPAPPPVVVKAVVDIDAVGQFEGQDIFDVDIDAFEDKPWRKPGADITDYFNYGFNEQTWKAYCAKQKGTREDQTQQGSAARQQNTVEYTADMQAFMPPYHPGVHRPGQELRPGKRMREDEEVIEITPIEPGLDRPVPDGIRDMRYHGNGYGAPDFNGPPPMGMFGGPDPYGHMPPPFMPPDVMPGAGYDPFGPRGPMPGRPSGRSGMRGDRPYFPMEPGMHPRFGRGPYEQRGPYKDGGRHYSDRRPSSPHTDRDPG